MHIFGTKFASTYACIYMEKKYLQKITYLIEINRWYLFCLDSWWTGNRKRMQERKASNCWLIGHIIFQKCILSYLTIQPIFNPIWWVPHSILAVYTFVNLAFYRSNHMSFVQNICYNNGYIEKLRLVISVSLKKIWNITRKQRPLLQNTSFRDAKSVYSHLIN